MDVKLDLDKDNKKKLVTLTELIHLQTEETNREMEQIKHNMVDYFVCGFLGLFLYVFGGMKWLFKIQIPQDRLLKIQLQIAENELKNSEIMHVANKFNRNYIPKGK